MKFYVSLLQLTVRSFTYSSSSIFGLQMGSSCIRTMHNQLHSKSKQGHLFTFDFQSARKIQRWCPPTTLVVPKITEPAGHTLYRSSNIVWISFRGVVFFSQVTNEYSILMGAAALAAGTSAQQ